MEKKLWEKEAKLETRRRMKKKVLVDDLNEWKKNVCGPQKNDLLSVPLPTSDCSVCVLYLRRTKGEWNIKL